MHTTSSECIDISAVHHILGEQTASALLSLHCVTGCDVVGKYNKKSKEFWTNTFFDHIDDSNIILALVGLHSQVTDFVLSNLERFVCLTYLKKYPNVRIKVEQLSKCRYFLFLRKQSNSPRASAEIITS